ncbi:MAG: DUF2158 domain-containing protein [Candidatus Sulfotelmatobacter sp.]
MADEFQVGDTVKLKSGSPRMTIASLGGQLSTSTTQGAWCDWFDEKNKREHQWFPLTSLVKVHP